MSNEFIEVEVAYAKPEKQRIILLSVLVGTTVYEAAELSGIVTEFPEIDLEKASLGVFGKSEKNPRQRVLKQGERVEIYRPLLIDPKEIRKKRAQKTVE